MHFTTTRTWAPTGFAFLPLAGMCWYAGLPVSSRASSAPEPAYRSAVVFQRADRGAWKYHGIVPNPRINLKPAASAIFVAPDKGDYRVVLLKDGDARTINVRISPLTVWETDSAGGARFFEPSEFHAIIRSARKTDNRVRLATDPIRTGKSQACYTVDFSTLANVTAQSGLIAVGRVIGIWRKGYTPLNYVNSLQHTVFLFAVENFIKGGGSDQALVLKVREQGSDLPYRDERGVLRHGMVFVDDAFLRVGERYILCVNQLGKEISFRRNPYPMAEVDGVSGRSGDWDEWIFMNPERAKFLIQNGIVNAANPSAYWEFLDGRVILGLTEQQAVTMIRQELDLAARK